MPLSKRNFNARNLQSKMSPANAFAMKLLGFLEREPRTIDGMRICMYEPGVNKRPSAAQIHDALSRIRSYLEDHEAATVWMSAEGLKKGGARQYEATEDPEKIQAQALASMMRGLGHTKAGLKRNDMNFEHHSREMRPEMKALVVKAGMVGYVCAGNIEGFLNGARVYQKELMAKAESAAKKPSSKELNLLPEGETWEERHERLTEEAREKYLGSGGEE